MTDDCEKILPKIPEASECPYVTRERIARSFIDQMGLPHWGVEQECCIRWLVAFQLWQSYQGPEGGDVQ